MLEFEAASKKVKSATGADAVIETSLPVPTFLLSKVALERLYDTKVSLSIRPPLTVTVG